MRRSASIFKAAVLAGVIAAFPGFVGAASAASNWQDFHFDPENYTERNFCGVSGFTVKFQETGDGRFRFSARGPERLPHLMQHATVVQVATNPANGKSVTAVQSRNVNTLDVTDNGDGTSTAIRLIVSRTVIYAESGETIGHYTGQARLKLLFDNGGTPTDPSDDQIISGKPIKIVEHGDDVCTTLIGAIG